MTLPADFPAQAGPARDQAILAAIRTGEASWTWSSITMTANGHVGVFSVMSDGLKIGGVRIAASAFVCQQVADLLSACLPTPRINDQCWLQAAIQIPPQTLWPAGTDTATMVKESSLIDGAIGNRAGLVAPVGKPWVLAKKSTTLMTSIYGWQSAVPIAGVPTYPSPATSNVKVVQPLSQAHFNTYVDYSSLISLVSRNCMIDGIARDLFDVLQDPVLSALVSHEGPLPVSNVRQPGVPVLPPLSGAPTNPIASGTPTPTPVSFNNGGLSPLLGAAGAGYAINVPTSSPGASYAALGVGMAFAGLVAGLYLIGGPGMANPIESNPISYSKNKTGIKALDKLAADPRVKEIWDEGDDGLWIQLVPGFNAEGVSGIHAELDSDLHDVSPAQARRAMVASLKEQFEQLVEPNES